MANEEPLLSVAVTSRNDDHGGSLLRRFGRGWYSVEAVRGEDFGWMSNDAGLFVQAPAGAPQVLCLEIKPGAGVHYRPFELQVRDARGRVVAQGRSTAGNAFHSYFPAGPDRLSNGRCMSRAAAIFPPMIHGC